MFSLQEISQNINIQNNLRATEDFMDKHGSFDPETCDIFRGLKKQEKHELSETLRHLTLREWATSTTLTTGSLGAGGLNYLVPTWLTQQIGLTICPLDIAPQIAGMYSTDLNGDLVTFNAIAQASVTQAMGGSGGGGFINSGSQAYMKRYTSNIEATNEMLEDQQYGLIQQAIQAAALKFARLSNDALIAVAIRTSGTVGFGAKQTANAGADTTTPAQLAALTAQVACPSQYGYNIPDLLLVTPEVWWDALITTAGHPDVTNGVNGYAVGYGALNVVFINGSGLGTVASNRLTDAKTVIANKQCSFAVARNNWLKIENYSDPIKDLSGAVISGKQAVAELNCATVGVLSET